MTNTLVQEIVDRIQQLGDRVDPAYRTRALTALDQAVQYYGQRNPWDSLRTTEVFTLSGEYLTLPDRVGPVFEVGDKTNQIPIPAGKNFLMKHGAPYLSRASGQPGVYRDMGIAPVVSQPATDAYLTVNSTVSEALFVDIKGLVRDTTASGTSLELFETQERLTLAGSTVTSTNLYVTVLGIQKQIATTADVRVFDSRTGLQISRIPNWDTAPQYRRLQFSFVPASPILVEVGYFRRPDRVKDENSVLPPAIDIEVVTWRAVGFFQYMQGRPDAGNMAFALADDMLKTRAMSEEAHDRKDHTFQPGFSYLEAEDAAGYFWSGGLDVT